MLKIGTRPILFHTGKTNTTKNDRPQWIVMLVSFSEMTMINMFWKWERTKPALTNDVTVFNIMPVIVHGNKLYTSRFVLFILAQMTCNNHTTATPHHATRSHIMHWCTDGRHRYDKFDMEKQCYDYAIHCCAMRCYAMLCCGMLMRRYDNTNANATRFHCICSTVLLQLRL